MQYELRVRKSVTTVPSDTVKLSEPGRGILVSVSGIVKIGFADGTTDSPFLAGGFYHPIEAHQIFSTGTDAAIIAGSVHIGW